MRTSQLLAALALLGAVTTSAGEVAEAVKAPAKPSEASRDASTAASASNAAPTKEPVATSRVDLDATQITGNRELPRVLYVVPWKRADLGEMAGKPAKSLLDEVLAPVDREVFRRQNRYHDALQTEATAPAADTAKGER